MHSKLPPGWLAGKEVIADMARLKWYGRERRAEVRAKTADIIDILVNELAATVQANIDTQGPPHSTPGEYPHRISGELQASIDSTIDRRELAGYVSATAPHSPYVEDMRPFLRRTMHEEKHHLQMRAKQLAAKNSGKIGRGKRAG